MKWTVEHLEEVDSTNTFLALRARNGAPSGLVVYADFQTAGRGRLDRTFEAPPGSALLCSLLLRLDVAPSDLQLVVIAVALSAKAALGRLAGLDVGLKWPNDLLAGEKKLAGLLAEYVVDPNGDAVVVGIGINLTSFPPDVNATSVAHETGVALHAHEVLEALLDELSTRCELLATDEGREQLRGEYAASLVTLGQLVRVSTHDGDFVGTAEGVDATGRLTVTSPTASRQFASGDVIHLRKEQTS